MPKVQWKTAAASDLMAIVDYISDDNPDAALALMDEIESKVACYWIIPSSAVLDAYEGLVS